MPKRTHFAFMRRSRHRRNLILLASYLLAEVILFCASFVPATLGVRAAQDTGIESLSLSVLTIAALPMP